MTEASSAESASFTGEAGEVITNSSRPAIPAWRQLMRDLMVLTKFRINVVGLFTGYAAIAIFRVMNPEVEITSGTVLLVMLALLMTGGAANTCNQIIEVNRDKNMSRTVDKRPLPSGRMSIRTAVCVLLRSRPWLRGYLSVHCRAHLVSL